MKRLLFLLFSAFLLLLAAGCTQNEPGPQTPDKQTTNPSSVAGEQSLPDISGLLNPTWPADEAPADLPEYTEGTLTASGKDGDTLYIRVTDTDSAQLHTYLNSLTDAGWIVLSDSEYTEAEAVRGQYTVRFDLQGGTHLQIAVDMSEAGVWLTGEIPPDVIPPTTGTLVEKINIFTQTEGMWYFNYTYDGIDETAAAAYMEMLLDSGWAGDTREVTKSFEWNGEQYMAMVEIYETLETRTTFTCNFWLEG